MGELLLFTGAQQQYFRLHFDEIVEMFGRQAGEVGGGPVGLYGTGGDDHRLLVASVVDGDAAVAVSGEGLQVRDFL